MIISEILRRRRFEYLEQVVAECFARSARSHDAVLKSTCAGLCWQDEGLFGFERIDEKALRIFLYVSSNGCANSIGIDTRCKE